MSRPLEMCAHGVLGKSQCRRCINQRNRVSWRNRTVGVFDSALSHAFRLLAVKRWLS